MENIKHTVLLTGAAGFIGASLAVKLINSGENVVGIDNLNSYYIKSLKLERLKIIEDTAKKNNVKWKFYKIDIDNEKELKKVFKENQPSIVINLAAQAGVRYSILKPSEYVKSNLVGFANILQESANYEVKHLIYASSSSVYGGNKKFPFSENDEVNHPVSFYAATKKANEAMAHSYSSIHKLPCTGLRFFTVYGPYGRPDMAPMIFADSILLNKPIKVFNFGNMKRDFTFVDDVIEAIYRCCYKIPVASSEFDPKNPKPSISFAPHRIFNVGNGQPTELITFIEKLEKALDKKAIINYFPMQQGDVESTEASVLELKNWINYRPLVDLDQGIDKFARWFLEYKKDQK